MEFIDYYKILEIDKSATTAEIKKAYRKQARKYHPDLNPNNKEAELKFKRLNEANEVLSDPEKRKKYDEYGKDWQHAEEFEKAKTQQQSSQQYASGDSYSYSGGATDEDFSDFFESMFGGGGFRNQRRQTAFRGQDFNAELQLQLRDVYTSQKQTLTVNNKKIRITIPAGIENGQTIKIKGHGATGSNGGPNGDLYITFSIINNTPFKREKANLYKTVLINLTTAVLGGEITAETFDGKVKLKVAPGVQNGQQVKLKGKGFPEYKKEGSFGDLYITYQIDLPSNLTEKQRELFEELKKTNL
ncbi:DnaJ-class molecular chaperone with C-terminal Zn finger domain [Galbibacter orientalis DSM 19592]|uniref:DnaJ-class molecular chaperone with C-terminal Zn finger domain n=1 Tax=Galbibacter orientalis DSM 19592 TaxID=926559 RepID=I3C1Z6_9FLAO|nr:J domain-containing protein [Galbibacter orientalis]EIJ37639.1 DnaJ-class molecular chaperone with C-terminal Zn finger domain [Galbibacter orientalis DSM 19592]